MIIYRLIKGIFFFFILFTFSLLLPPHACAAEQNSPLTVSVSVETVFKLEVDKNSIDFGSVEPGESTPQKNIQILCSSNVNVPWKLSVHVESPLTYQEYEIPNSHFLWQADTVNASGQVIAPSGEMDLAPLDFYRAATNEYITHTPVELLLITSVDVPLGQVSGRYESVIVVTMQPEQ